jgi:hypothetical protein
MEAQDKITIHVGAITLNGYPVRHDDKESADDVPSFISPRRLKRQADKGMATRNVTEDEQDDRQ